MPKIKVKLNLHEKPSGKIIKLGKIVEAELIECSEHEVKVQLPNGDVIRRKRATQIEGEIYGS